MTSSVTLVLHVAAVVAWEAGLLERSANCDSGFDCFDANSTYIEDCHDFDGGHVRCYRLIHRFDLAIVALGGVMAVASSSVTFYGNITLPIWKVIVTKYDWKGQCMGYLLIAGGTIAGFEVVAVILAITAGQFSPHAWKLTVVYFGSLHV